MIIKMQDEKNEKKKQKMGKCAPHGKIASEEVKLGVNDSES